MFRLPMLSCFFFCLLCAGKVCAQLQLPDTMCTTEAVAPFLETLYKQQNSSYANLYSGSEYIGTYPGTKGSANFEWDTLQQGSIKYNGICYPNIWLKYDLVQNAIVINGKQNLAIALVPEKIDLFSIRNHVFIHVKPERGKTSLPENGFYEVLFKGAATSILVSRRKNIERGSSVEDPNIFKQYNTYFVNNGVRYFPIDTQKDLLNLFENQRDKVRQFIKDYKLDFKRNKEESLLKTVAYYNTL